MNGEAVKSHAVTVAMWALGFVAGRYHLSGEQVSMIAGDVGSVALLGYKVFDYWGMKKAPAPVVEQLKKAGDI